ncbi:hypothetical protein N7488_004239, partial [Penicillium malachiteum]
YGELLLQKPYYIVDYLYYGNLPDYLDEAVKVKAYDILTCLFESGNALNDIEMIIWLLDHEADPNRQCYIDMTPFSYAVERAPLPIVELFIRRGGDVTKGQVLHHALDRKSDTVDVLKLLICRGAPVNAIMYKDHQPSWDMYFFMGQTPLHRAVYLRKVDAIHYLLSQGADPNMTNFNKQTVMQIADEESRREISKYSHDT